MLEFLIVSAMIFAGWRLLVVVSNLILKIDLKIRLVRSLEENPQGLELESLYLVKGAAPQEMFSEVMTHYIDKRVFLIQRADGLWVMPPNIHQLEGVRGLHTCRFFHRKHVIEIKGRER